MNKQKRFYVYVHIRKNGTPFYVGKGHGKRVTDKTSRSSWWKKIVLHDYPTEKFPSYVILADMLSEQEALDIEVYWIALFGRRNVHSNGLLVNNTDGGEGTVGAILSSSTRRKMSTARKGNKNPMWGTTRPDSVKQAVSAANTGKVNVWKGKIRPDSSRLKMSLSQGSKPTTYIHIPSGKIVTDVINKTEFARQYGLNAGHISAVARRERPSHKGWKLYTQIL